MLESMTGLAWCGMVSVKKGDNNHKMRSSRHKMTPKKWPDEAHLGVWQEHFWCMDMMNWRFGSGRLGGIFWSFLWRPFAMNTALVMVSWFGLGEMHWFLWTTVPLLIDCL